MLSRAIKGMRRRVGPVGLSLIAAALTAAAFAAVSTAAKDDGGSDKKQEDGPAAFHHRIGPPQLSEEDQAKLEEFRQCMEDNGADLPDPGEMRGRMKEGELPEPPSEAEIEKMQKAHEACADKLPEGAELGFGHGPAPGGPGCGPPGARPRESGSNREGTAVPAPPSGGSQGDVMVAPQGATS